ncbi:NAD(P)/FAD-dependent oxidoreductase [Paenarthrobacter sp. PH39-S1]|uniref:NAD(P)/FAD-dependent oxidoreductase n=1 Tax=Paenarthrobacter sp. PH39-S1 TaxID=3046204 RepID=UPI0024BAF7D0|nr:NAD(P)/FAD-dependent oxidoreductase [Paenarthrobacter sp. PH39-S1]MDJ0356607.1 NAD(P)/FAD-dependent oxidoreductase [Paenarthrobacter sp. PH39-S1]
MTRGGPHQSSFHTVRVESRSRGLIVVHQVEVAIIGGGVAGLQAALTLGRARRSVALFDDGHPRNAAAEHVRNYLSVEDETPFGLLTRGEQMLDPYNVERVSSRVISVDGDLSRGFTLRAGKDQFHSRCVVLAGGVEDLLPAIPGLADHWGTSVVACPHCHGWEVRDRPLAQVAFSDDMAQGCERAILLSSWSEDITFFPNRDDVDAETSERLRRSGVKVRLGQIEEIHNAVDGVLGVRLGTGYFNGFAAVFSTVRQVSKSRLAERLGCELTNDVRATGIIRTEPNGRTTIPGVWAAGSCTNPAFLAIGAAGHASVVATSIHSDLIARDLAT